MGRAFAGLILPLTLLGLAACGGGSAPAPTPSPTPPSTATAAAPTATRATLATPTATEPQPAALEPLGFPIDPALRLGLVGEDRTIRWGAGPDALAYSRDDQPSDDARHANRSGWNCRVHVEYEGRPAIDWYIPIGTPIRATMDGTATLYVITVANAFDYYGVDRAPYVGDPDRAQASVAPFPGPGGGKGVFVRVENDRFSTEYAHLDLTQTAALVPPQSFLSGYSPSSDYDALFAAMRNYRDSTPIARWGVRRGDVIGISGDAGYSEAPHLHYTVGRAGGDLLCPTTEAGFSDGGWLFRLP